MLDNLFYLQNTVDVAFKSVERLTDFDLKIVLSITKTTAKPTSVRIQIPTGGFMTPNSTLPLLFSVKVSTVKNVAKAAITGAALDAVAATRMLSGSVAPLSNKIGAINQSVRVSLNLTATPVAGESVNVAVYFPAWSEKLEHYISTAAPTCTLHSHNASNGTNATTQISQCKYDTATRLLKVTFAPTNANNSVDQALMFDVEGAFRNPYSGAVRSGFYIARTDSDFLGFTEQSADASFAVTEPATIEQASLARADNVLTVGELASFDINFNVGLPVEKNTYLVLTFPSIVPVDSGLTQVKMSGFASNTVTATDNQVVINCNATSFTEAKNSALKINIKNLRNPGSAVRSIESFKISLFTAQGEPIAAGDASMILVKTNLTIGQISALTVSYELASKSVNFTFTPAHQIPAKSMVVIQVTGEALALPDGPCIVSYQNFTSSGLIFQNSVVMQAPFGQYAIPKLTPASFILSTSNTIKVTSGVTASFVVETFAAPVQGGIDFIDIGRFDNEYVAWYLSAQRLQSSMAVIE